MNITKTHTFLTAALLAGFQTAGAQVTNEGSFQFVAQSSATYQQSPTDVTFQGGSFNIGLRDGLLIYESPCILDEYFPPNPPEDLFGKGKCAQGATGYITAGDIDGDGVNDSQAYATVSQIIAARSIRPFEPQNVRLVAAPPSELPRPLSGFTGSSAKVFFNIQSPIGSSEYSISGYRFSRVYLPGDRSRFDKEIVPGSYTFTFPRLGQTPGTNNNPIAQTLNLFPTLDGYRKVNNQRVGFRFKNVIFDGGFAVLDPNIVNVIEWEGNTGERIIPGNDTAYVSIRALTAPEDPNSGTTGEIIFPNFTGVSNQIILPSPVQTSYALAPGFLAPGESGLFEIEFSTYRPTTSVAFERSVRRFRLPVKMGNFMTTALRAALPANATNEQRDPSADYDGDGASNFAEWAFGSDPAKAGSVPPAPSLELVNTQAAPGTFSEIGSESHGQGCWEYKVDKLINPIPALDYHVEHSTDMKTWVRIDKSDDKWNFQETSNQIKVSCQDDELHGGGFFRVKVVTK
ncbi:hypothetical protein ACFSSA_02950 [Luteolibacter algae]|uniref:Uncharacterized protein n=1 Tax=Luteolibacter algae TaxID=454151 RepID=A0ABW5D7Q0_9BACT